MPHMVSAPERPLLPALTFVADTGSWTSFIGAVLLPAMRRLGRDMDAPAWVISVPRNQRSHLHVTLTQHDQSSPVAARAPDLLVRLADQFASPSAKAALLRHGGAACTFGHITPIWPSGSARLALIRDQLYAEMLSIFAPYLIRNHARAVTLLAHSGLTLALVHRIRWTGDAPLWPMSLYGQVRAARHHFPDLTDVLRQQRGTFLPMFSAALAQSGYLGPDFIPSRRDARILGAFQRCYDAVQTIIGSWPATRIREQAGDVSRHLGQLMPEIDDDLSILDNSGPHLSFRVFMTMLYDSLPIFDIGASRRILLFDTLLRAADAVSPGIFDRTAEAGRALVTSGTVSH